MAPNETYLKTKKKEEAAGYDSAHWNAQAGQPAAAPVETAYGAIGYNPTFWNGQNAAETGENGQDVPGYDAAFWNGQAGEAAERTEQFTGRRFDDVENTPQPSSDPGLEWNVPETRPKIRKIDGVVDPDIYLKKCKLMVVWEKWVAKKKRKGEWPPC